MNRLLANQQVIMRVLMTDSSYSDVKDLAEASERTGEIIKRVINDVERVDETWNLRNLLRRRKETRMSCFKLVDTRYRVDGRELAWTREGLGLNQSQFAYACGWSSGYQWQLENGRVDSVSEATKNVIEDVIERTK